ncbi:CoA transferase [Streptomyces caniscabiei]|uniref:CaiB/BaiF CoA-transferase family protein n=2 Tax=Streptomyces caniscabiei TaxID=2746961 RepID=UPI0029AEC9E2|nr:CoA transferase [Streptomyces caniscabiei]MDX2604428.1 CoA transferase [Streptomyces caniscabiei]MDX2735770.1 CoA transferase [Streptomyces caniscabiei]
MAGQRTFRVVEVTESVAGAACGRLFAALGHDVLLCEPPTGTLLRAREFTFAALGSGKRSAVLRTEQLTAGGTSPLAGADVLITDLTPAAAAAEGLDLDGLRQRFPRLVVVSLTAFGLTGEYAESVGDSLLAEAYGGLATMIGEPDRRPLGLGGEQSAHSAAFVGLYGAMLALRHRDRTGRGDLVEVALSDVAAYMDWKSDVLHDLGGGVPRRAGSSQGGWRVVRAKDGWVGVIFHAQQWPAVVELFGDPRLSAPGLDDPEQRAGRSTEWWAVIAEAAASREAVELYTEAQRLGLPFGHAADAEDLLTDPQLRARGFVLPPGSRRRDAPVVGLPWTVPGVSPTPAPAPRLGEHDQSEGEGSDHEESDHDGSDHEDSLTVPPRPAVAPAPRAAVAAPPLDGLVVLDFGTITAGAATSRLLADYGATVVKIESHGRPDPFRRWVMPGSAEQADGPPPPSPMFASNNAGKRGLSLDLKTEAGRATAHELIRRADVLVENFRVGVTARMGIDYATVHRLNPDLVYLSLSSQGVFGPEARYGSFGSTLDLLSGLAAVTGYPGERPMWSGGDVNYPDQVVSFVGAALVADAVTSGRRGIHLDVSQREAVAWTLADQLGEYVWTGRVPAPDGNRRPGAAPHDTYPTAEPDGWLAIACTNAGQRRALAEVITALPGQAPEDWWLRHQDTVDTAIAEWTARRARDAAVAELRSAGVPAVPVNTAADRARDPRYRERRAALRAPEWLKGFPLILHGHTPPDPAPAPALGENAGRPDADALDALVGGRGTRTPSPR